MTAQAQAAETTTTEIIALGVTDSALAELREEFKEVPDATEKEGYKSIQAGIKKLRGFWVAVKDEADKQKEHALAHQRRVNSEKDRIIDALKEIAAPLQTAKKDVDEAAEREKEEEKRIERERIGTIEAKLNRYREMAYTQGLTEIPDIEARLNEINAVNTDDIDEDYREQADGILGKSRATVEQYLQDRKNFEADKAENLRKTKKLDEREAEQKRTTDIQARINRIRMTPADLVGRDLDTMKHELEKLNLVDLDQGFDELKDEARDALSDTISKIQGMIDHQKDTNKQQEDLKTAQAETARKNKEQDEREAAEQAKKDRQREAAALKSRLPEDKKLRIYADELVSIKCPDVESPELVAVVREVLLQLTNIRTYVIESTQDSE